MGMFHRKPVDTDSIREAHAARERAEGVITSVQTRETEVNSYVRNLRVRRRKNNFGDALMIAMERRYREN
jgi:hypothetical protein